MNTQELESGITKLKRRVNDLEQLRADNARHDDPAVEVVETNISNTVLEIFAKESKEYEQYQNHEIWHGDFNIGEDRQSGFTKGIEHSLAAMNGLISRLKEKKEDLSLPVQPDQTEHVVKGEGVNDWNRDFYRLLEDGGWISYKTYRKWFQHTDIKKQRLIAALDHEEVKFRIIDEQNRNKPKFTKEVWNKFNDSHYRRKHINNLWSLRPPAYLYGYEIILEAESFLVWLKENYPLEEIEQMNPTETAEDITSDNLQADSQGLFLPLKHEYEASLLKIAVECWKALYEDGSDGSIYNYYYDIFGDGGCMRHI